MRKYQYDTHAHLPYNLNFRIRQTNDRSQGYLNGRVPAQSKTKRQRKECKHEALGRNTEYLGSSLLMLVVSKQRV